MCPNWAPNKNRSGGTNTEAAKRPRVYQHHRSNSQTNQSITIGAVCPLIVADFPRKGKAKKMEKCIKCSGSLPPGALYCPYCGKKQTATERKQRKRGNGEGSVFRYRSGWRAQIVVGYKLVGGKSRAVYRTKAGFKTKKDAIDYLATLLSPAFCTMFALAFRSFTSQSGTFAPIFTAFSKMLPSSVIMYQASTRGIIIPGHWMPMGM